MPSIKFLIQKCSITGLNHDEAIELINALNEYVLDFTYNLYSHNDIEMNYIGHNYYISLALLEYFIKGYFKAKNQKIEFIN